MNWKRYIVDTTLRDGEQMAGKIFSKEQKINIAGYLDSIGIYQIEAGIPAMGNIEKDCLNEIIENKKHSLISTWNRLNKEDIQNSFDCNPDIIHISVPTSNLQIFTNLKKDKTWIENKMKECVYLAKENGYEVTVGFEDASRADIDYLVFLANILKSMDVSRVRYSDTVGILTPKLVRENITRLIDETKMEVEMHTHNDFGMALATAIEGLKSGAKYIDCTLDGIGERAGNCKMQEFLRVTENFKIQ